MKLILTKVAGHIDLMFLNSQIAPMHKSLKPRQQNSITTDKFNT